MTGRPGFHRVAFEDSRGEQATRLGDGGSPSRRPVEYEPAEIKKSRLGGPPCAPRKDHDKQLIAATTSIAPKQSVQQHAHLHRPCDRLITSAHASEDKKDFVEPLVAALDEFFDVWFDKRDLTIGDSLLDCRRFR